MKAVGEPDGPEPTTAPLNALRCNWLAPAPCANCENQARNSKLYIDMRVVIIYNNDTHVNIVGFGKEEYDAKS
jgi:hypothetical protein